jgi:uncharacterized protein
MVSSVLLLGTVSFIAWFVSMLAGGGSPLVLIPLVNSLWGVQATAPVITIGMLIGNGQRSLFFWQQINWQVTLWYLPGAIAGAIIGAYGMTRLHLEWLQWLIGLGLLLMALNFLLKRSEKHFPVKAWYFLPAAFVNATASALIGSTGPVMNPLYLSYGLVKEPMIATKSFHKTVLHLIKVLAYLGFGLFKPEYWFYGLVIGLASIPANWLGKWVLERMSVHQFKAAVFALIAFSGLLMLWQQSQHFNLAIRLG